MEFRLKINCKPVGKLIYLITAKYNNEQQPTYYTFPAGSTNQHVTSHVFLYFPRETGNGNFHTLQMSNFSPISWRAQVTFNEKYDDEIMSACTRPTSLLGSL
jgi:hypothetical protein